MSRAGVALLFMLSACGSVSTTSPLELVDGAAGELGAAGHDAAATGAGGAAGAPTEGGAGSVGLDGGAPGAAGGSGPPLPERCEVSSFTSVCWIDLSTGFGCLQGCKDTGDAGVVGTGCTVSASPHHATCVEYCGACPPQN